MSVSSQPNDRVITEMMATRESPPQGQRIDFTGPTTPGDAVSATRRFAMDQGLGTRDRAHLCIIVEELVTNLIEHGGDGERHIELELAREASSIAIVIEDDGAAFDPRDASANANIPARGGGAGLRLVSAWSRLVDYQATDGRNRLELEMPLTERQA